MYAAVIILIALVAQPTPEPMFTMFGGNSNNPIKCVAPASGSAKVHCEDSKGVAIDLPIVCDSQMVICTISK